MDTEVHGKLRVLGRTKVHPDDIRRFVAANACVSLGKVPSGREYLLFYSLPDRGYRIAVMAENRTVLVTILEKSPPYVAPMSDGACHAARVRMSRFLAKHSAMRIVAVEPEKIEVCIALSVSESGVPFYAEDLGQAVIVNSVTTKRIAAAARSKLDRIKKIVFDRAQPGCRIRYHFTIRTPAGRLLQEMTLKPETLARYLAA